eukprot:1979500-Lingulodinium_polyedra.AAC.1
MDVITRALAHEPRLRQVFHVPGRPRLAVAVDVWPDWSLRTEENARASWSEDRCVRRGRLPVATSAYRASAGAGRRQQQPVVVCLVPHPADRSIAQLWQNANAGGMH